jgi:hypothetical protein
MGFDFKMAFDRPADCIDLFVGYGGRAAHHRKHENDAASDDLEIFLCVAAHKDVTRGVSDFCIINVNADSRTDHLDVRNTQKLARRYRLIDGPTLCVLQCQHSRDRPAFWNSQAVRTNSKTIALFVL